jgi:RNA polymerase sigma-70 factor (ECF subfamily)
MSAAAILSVAARKAAHEAKKVGAQAMVFALFLMLAIGAFVNFTGRGTQTQQLAESQAPTQSQAPETQSPSESVQTPAETSNTGEAEIVAAPVAQVSKPSASPSVSASPFTKAELNQIFDLTPEETQIFFRTSVDKGVDVRQGYRVLSSNGIIADFTFDANAAEPFGDVLFRIDVDGKQYIGYPYKSNVVHVTDKDGRDHYVFFGDLDYLFDEDGKVWSESEVAQGTARLEMIVEKDGRSLNSSVLVVMPKGFCHFATFFKYPDINRNSPDIFSVTFMRVSFPPFCLVAWRRGASATRSPIGW